MILLDTNVISEPLRLRPDATVLAWMDAQALDALFLSTVSLAELGYGITRLPEGNRRLHLLRDLNERVLPLFENRILPFGVEAAAAYAMLCAGAEHRGKAIGTADAYIAAIAAAHGLTVATRDPRPFQDAGVPVINLGTSIMAACATGGRRSTRTL